MDKYDISLFESERWFSLEDFEGEIWKDVVGYEGNYKVSNFGRVKALKRYYTNSNQQTTEKIMKAFSNGRGYFSVGLSKKKKIKKFYIHRIVALAFIPNPFSLPHINHRDENKINNCVENLEWCTPTYNNKYGTARIRANKTWREKGLVQPIDMYDMNGKFLKHYNCALDIEKDGISRRAAYNVCYGRAKSYKGCVFRFAGDSFSYTQADNSSKGYKKQIAKADINGNLIKVYESVVEAQKENGLKRNRLYSATYAYSRKALINGCYYYAY